MKYTKQLAGFMCLMGLSLSQTSSLLAQSAEEAPVPIAQAESEAVKAMVVDVSEATLLPGNLVAVRECVSDPVQLFYTENETALQADDRVYIIDGNLFSDASGSTPIASNYAEASAAWLASRQASIAQMFVRTETQTQEIPVQPIQPQVQPAPVQPTPPAPVRALW
ncbi:MAG: hypothetical protein AAFY11_14795 [Cyanobacteria bacterium J06641_5]